ncbi:MAG: protein TolB [Oligoflexia bacterium]|nr:MAG: protein TolB [Oligoflexia bacterium]
MKLFLLSAFVFLFGAVSFSNESGSPGAQIYIKLGDAQTKRSLIAFPSLQYTGNTSAASNYQTVGNELYRVIFNDLSVSTYFQFIQQSAFLEDPNKTSLLPQGSDPKGFKFDTWKQIGTEFLLRAGFSMSGDSLTLETYTYHVPRGTVVLAKKYKGTVAALRRVAHTFSNDLLEALTGQKGMFLSRIVTTSDRAGGESREVYVMDWDGFAPEKISNHKSVALSPAWSPDNKKIAYTAFVQRAKTKIRNADMFIYEVLTGKRWLVSYRQGINSGASFTPDGDILLTISQSGTPDIYKMTTEGTLSQRLTNGPHGAMNVEPAMSPDGKKIAFSSDRSGQPMIYIMDSNGSNIKRVTFAGKYNATPAWSPDGKKLAFAGWADDHFDVFTMNADGSDMIRITSSKKPNGKWANNEDPVFSPDGRLLMFTSNRTGNNQIYISNLDGSEERRITNDNHNYFKPKWSKNIE